MSSRTSTPSSLTSPRSLGFEGAACPCRRERILDLITDLYRVEHEATERGLCGNAKLEFWKVRAGPIREANKAWLDAQQPRHPPKSPPPRRDPYTLAQWSELAVFLDDERVPLDDNASERSLRRIALGRRKLPLCLRRRGVKEPRRPLLTRCHLRVARDQPVRLPRRRARRRAGSPREPDRRAAAGRLGRRGLSRCHDAVRRARRTVTPFSATRLRN